MPNTVPAAAIGLPEETAVLAETDRGLAVVRPAALKALQPSFLAPEEIAELIERLDAYVAAESLSEHRRDTLEGPNHPSYLKARDNAKRARRKLIGLLQKLRHAKSKTLDDVLFKALLCEAVDRLECRRSETVAHSIVNDLLSADCMWRAA